MRHSASQRYNWIRTHQVGVRWHTKRLAPDGLSYGLCSTSGSTDPMKQGWLDDMIDKEIDFERNGY